MTSKPLTGSMLAGVCGCWVSSSSVAGKWKTGHYDPASRVFVGSAGRRITTVINDAKPQYIENLKAAQP